MPRCCDPLRAFASLKPNRAAMMDSSSYERAIEQLFAWDTRT